MYIVLPIVLELPPYFIQSRTKSLLQSDLTRIRSTHCLDASNWSQCHHLRRKSYFGKVSTANGSSWGRLCLITRHQGFLTVSIHYAEMFFINRWGITSKRQWGCVICNICNICPKLTVILPYSSQNLILIWKLSNGLWNKGFLWDLTLKWVFNG